MVLQLAIMGNMSKTDKEKIESILKRTGLLMRSLRERSLIKIALSMTIKLKIKSQINFVEMNALGNNRKSFDLKADQGSKTLLSQKKLKPINKIKYKIDGDVLTLDLVNLSLTIAKHLLSSKMQNSNVKIIVYRGYVISSFYSLLYIIFSLLT